MVEGAAGRAPGPGGELGPVSLAQGPEAMRTQAVAALGEG